MDVIVGKITINSTKIEKEETHAHGKRARSALSKERTRELRQCCDSVAPQVGSVRSDWTRVVKLNGRKTGPYSVCVCVCVCVCVYRVFHDFRA